MLLSAHFGPVTYVPGRGPMLWGDPQVPDELLATALEALPKPREKGKHSR